MEPTGQESVREEAAQQRPTLARYVVVWGALVVLTTATFLLARVDLGRLNLAVALVIATLKASLVVLFFMHLWDSRGANRVAFGLAVFYFLLLLGGILGDVATRYPLAKPPEVEAAKEMKE